MIFKGGDNTFLDGGRLLMDLHPVAKNIIEVIQTDASLNLSDNEALYVNYIVSNLIEQGIWDKIKALYGFVGGTAATHKWNWKDMRDLDVAFRLKNGQYSTISTGNTNQGISFQGSYNYMQTSFFPVTNGLTKNNFHLSIYSNSGNQGYDIGNSESANGTLAVASNRYGVSVGLSGGTSSLIFSTQKKNTLVIITSNSYSLSTLWAESSIIATNSTIRTGGFENNEITLGNLGNTATPSYECNSILQFASIGNGLTDQQAITFSNIVTTAQKILNRA